MTMIDPTEDWRKTRLVVVDVEGNGRQPPSIVELAVLPLEGGRIVAPPLQWLIRPAESISPAVTRLHGITDEMVATAPRFEEIAPSVQDLLGNDCLVAHNATVELGILEPLLPNWNPRGVVDTLRLAREFLPGRKSYALATLTEDLGLAERNELMAHRQHRAAFDVLATARLFLQLAFDEWGSARPLSALAQGIASRTAKPTTAQGRLF